MLIVMGSSSWFECQVLICCKKSYVAKSPYTATFSLSRRPGRRLYPQHFLQALKVLLNRAGKIAAPFPPGTGVIPDLLESGQLQDKIQPRRPYPARAITDDVMVRLQPFLFESGFDGCEVFHSGIGIQEPVPGKMNRGRNMARTRDAGYFFS